LEKTGINYGEKASFEKFRQEMVSNSFFMLYDIKIMGFFPIRPAWRYKLQGEGLKQH
jgi:hypothetical protein